MLCKKQYFTELKTLLMGMGW